LGGHVLNERRQSIRPDLTPARPLVVHRGGLDLMFEVVASTTPTTPTEPPPGVAPVAVPVPADPDYSG
jgi:hypothetical protein